MLYQQTRVVCCVIPFKLPQMELSMKRYSELYNVGLFNQRKIWIGSLKFKWILMISKQDMKLSNRSTSQKFERINCVKRINMKT